jgi:hypothetical protein
MALIQKTTQEIIRCTNPLPKTDVNYPLEWKINTINNEYIDPRIQLLLELEIRKADGGALVNRITQVRFIATIIATCYSPTYNVIYANFV